MTEVVAPPGGRPGARSDIDRPSPAGAGQPSGRHSYRASRYVVAGGLYLVTSIGLWWHVWSSGPSTVMTCDCTDAGRMVWYLEWSAFALAHGHQLLSSNWLFHPVGFNLLSDTSAPAIGVVMSPVTLLFGPVTAMNVASTLIPALTALSMFWLLQRCLLYTSHGPVFNVGERVEAYSDPLWLFLVAGVHEVLPFVDLGWLSVYLGLAGTAIGVVLAGRAVQRLAGGREGGVTLPIGLVIFSVVAGVWEFATSGLEMGLTFCWIGLGFWLLVRTEERRTSAVWCAFVIGLGTLIRPELILMTVVELGALAVVVGAAGWKGPPSVLRRYLAPLGAAVALPVVCLLYTSRCV